MKVLVALLMLAYPFLMLIALREFEARWVALWVGAVLVGRWVIQQRASQIVQLRAVLVPALLVVAAVSATFLTNDERALFLLPVAVNAGLLAAFGRTLFGGPTLVETIARARVPDLPDEEVRYCWIVTATWCLFFLANGTGCAWLAIAGEPWLWAMYTGFGAYVLMGLLFAIEFTVRAWRFGRYRGSVVEPLFRLLFRSPV